MALSEQDQARLETEARHVRDAGALGRSDVLVRLFDFLLECSLADRAPKEIEIAQEVFGKRASFDIMEDASVRVYVHRLRRKLEEFYVANDVQGERLVIRRGQYRLALAAQVDDRDGAMDPVEAPVRSAPGQWRPGRRAFIGGFAALGAANLAAWAAWEWRRPDDRLGAVANTSLWHPFIAADRPAIVVVGDYYIFGEAPDTVQVNRLVREFEINSRDDLDSFLMANPGYVGRYVDLDLHYLPVSTARALQTILPLVTGAAARGSNPLRLMTMSELTPEQLKSANIVYLGFLSGLGMLRDPVFDISGFKIGASYDEIVDRRTNRRYVSDWAQITDGGRQRRDYSYIASLPGPTGNRVMIIAGTRDAAVMQAAEAAADPKVLAQIAAGTGNAEAFEALYEVSAIGSLNLDSTFVVARALRGAAAWRTWASDEARFPDQMSPPPRPRQSR